MNQIEITKKSVVETGKRLLKEGLVVRTWGNVSVRFDKNSMLITPSGRNYNELSVKDIVLVDIISNKYEGTIKPSSEYMLHSAIYRSRSEINAVIHTHQMNASTVAAARRKVPPILDDMAQIIGPDIRVADYAKSASKKIIRNILRALKGRMAALMANHGAICIGRDIEEAFVVCQVLEKACKAFIEAEFLGGAKSISKFEAFLLHREYLKKYSKQNLKNK